MKLDIYFYENYRSFLADLIEKNAQTKGFRTRLATAARCQKSFLSQVMAEKVHLTPDHAANIAVFLGFDHDQTAYLIDLVTLARAGSGPLKKVMQDRITRQVTKKRQIANRFTDTHQIDFKHHAEFYGQWFVSAVYMLLGHTNDVKTIALRLDLPEEVVATTIETLERIGLIFKDARGRTIKKESMLFLKDSPFKYSFRSSWRNVGMLKQQLPNQDASFFTMLWSLSRENRAKILRLFTEAISASQELCDEQPQKEETLICVNLDFFDV